MKILKKLLLIIFAFSAAVLCTAAFAACDVHEHSWGEWEVTAKTDCVNDGKLERSCSVCGEKQNETVPATGIHSWSEWEETTPASCLEDGTESRSCTVCKKEEQRAISAIGSHSWSEWKEVTPASCLEYGTEERTCSVCKEKEQNTISAPGEHNWGEWQTVTEAICGKNGTEERTCSVCKEKEQNTIPAPGEHEWSDWQIVTAATCGKDGRKEHTCSICKETESGTIPATGLHAWSEWEEVTPVKCLEDGTEEHTCSVCNESEQRKLPAVGSHSWSEWRTITEATCGNDGTREHTCTACNETESGTIPATGVHNFDDDGVCTVCGESSSMSGSAEEVATAQLSIHFLELGNKYTGDSTLIKCGNTEVLIDAGSRENSATAIKSYVDKYCTDGVLEYVITTHAHQDHIAGFVGSNNSGILYQYKVGTLIQFARTNATTKIYNSYLTAVEYAKGRGTQVYTALQCWNNSDGAQRTYYLDNDGKVSLNILYNYYYENKASNENDYSVCMLLTNEGSDRTYNYLFTGDLEASGESYLVDKNNLPEVDLFKGGHHGSYTASTEKLLNKIKPKNVAVCCCCGTTEYTTNNENTFPAQAFIDRVAKYTENIYCTTLILDYGAGKYTSMNGNIVFYYNKRFKLYCTNNDTILKETDWFKAHRTWNGI